MKKLKMLALCIVAVTFFAACGESTSQSTVDESSSVADASSVSSQVSESQSISDDQSDVSQPDNVDNAIVINPDYIKMLEEGNGAIKTYFDGKDYGFSHGIALDAGGIIYMSYYQNAAAGYNFDSPAISFSFADKGPDEWNELLDSDIIGDATTTNNAYPDDWQVAGIDCASPTVFQDVFPEMPAELADGNMIENLDTYLGMQGVETYTPEEDLGGSTTLAKYTYDYSLELYNVTVSFLADIEGALPSIYITKK